MSTHHIRDVTATLTGQQLETQVITTWVLQNTYVGPFNGLALSNPGQVAKDSTGRILIADTGNNRLVILTSAGIYSTGITGLTGITGVAVDPSDNVYVHYIVSSDQSAIRKYNASLVQEWDTASGPVVLYGAVRHLASDGTYVFFTQGSGSNRVRRLSAATGGSAFVFGSSGSGNGQFNTPWGIAIGGSEVYVLDQGNSRVQVFTLAGVYVRQFPVSASARGIALDASGDVLVAEYGQDAVKRYTNIGAFTDSFAQTDPDGIAVATGDVPWVSNASAGTIAKWDESSTPGGYGQVAIEIAGDLGPYLGIGNRDGSICNVHTAVVTGDDPIDVRVFAKATSGTMTLKNLVLDAKATPRGIYRQAS